MTQTIQPGQHPDADQLSAFAEHALPPLEQQQLFAHLAACSDCRALVFLAQEAVPAAATLPHPVAKHKPWFSLFSGWKLAFPLTALACLVLVTLHLHNVSTANRDATITKTAQLEQASPQPAAPPPPAQPTPLKAAPAESPKPLAIAAPTINVLKEEKTPGAASFHGNAQPLGLGGIAGRSAAAPPSASESRSEGASHQSSFGIISSSGYTRANSAPTPAAAPTAGMLAGSLSGPLPQTAAPSPNTLADQATVNAPVATQPRPAPSATAALHSLNQQYSAAPPLPPPPPQQQTASAAGAGIGNVTQTVSVAPAAVPLETESNDSSAVIARESIGSLQSNKSLMRKKEAALPSRLPVVSTTSNGHQQLALDSAGALFRSGDAGVTWRPVAVQWTGRAIKLALAPSPNAPAKDALAAAPAAKAAPTPPPLFQLTNEAGQLWTSPDGQTWTHR